MSKTIYLLRIDFLADCRYFRYMLQVTIITLLHDLLLPGTLHPERRRVPHDRRNIVTLLGKLTQGDPVVRGHWPASPPINAASGVILSS